MKRNTLHRGKLKALLKNQVWEDTNYAPDSQNQTKKIFFRNPAQISLLKYSKDAKSILEIGCGDGRIMEILWRDDASFVGVDISQRAITSAKKRFETRRNVRFYEKDIEKLGKGNQNFELVYSCYAIEHTQNPEKVIKNMINMLKSRGRLVIVCPNFGSPFHPSPSSPNKSETLISRAIKIILRSHYYLFAKPGVLEWRKVFPKALKKNKWERDWDTSVEPFLQTLIYYLKGRGLKVLDYSSFIETTDKYPRLALRSYLRGFFEFLGKLGLAPYKYWGPTIFIAAEKV